MSQPPSDHEMNAEDGDEEVEVSGTPVPDSGQDSESPSSEEDGGEDASFLEVLRYLLQGGGGVSLSSTSDLRLRLVGNRDRGDADDDDSSDSEGDHDYDPRRRRAQREKTPKPPTKPDTSIIDKSDFKQQMLYESGLEGDVVKQCGNVTRHIPGFVQMKEAGLLNKRQNMSLGQIASTSVKYLPNSFSPKRVFKRRDKFFCGMYNVEGDMFLSACQDAKLRIFDTTLGQWKIFKSVDCKDVGWSVLDIDCSHNGNHIIYSSWSEYMHIVNIRGEHEQHDALFLNPGPAAYYRTAIFSLRFNQDDTEIVAGANGGYIYIYDMERKERTMKIDAHEDDLSGVCFADNSGHIIYSGGEDAVVKVWDRRNLREDNPQPVGQLAGHYDSITHIDSKNDGRYLITNSKDQSIKLWDIRRFATDDGIKATKSAVARQDWDYRWHPYSGKIIKKKLDGDCSLMTYYGHSVVRTLIRAKFSPAFNTGQRFIYAGDGIGRVVIYDILTGKIERILEGSGSCGHHKEVIRDVSWHPYENNIVSSGWDGNLIKWECNSPDEW